MGRKWEKKKKNIEAEKEKRFKSAEEAKNRSLEAQKALDDIENTLKCILNSNLSNLWDKLSNYENPQPDFPDYEMIPDEPMESDAIYQPKIKFFDKIFSSHKQRKIDNAIALYKYDHKEWLKVKESIDKANNKIKRQYDIKVKNWIDEKDKYQLSINKRSKAYYDGKTDAILDYCDIVLSNSSYPDSFPQEYDIDYKPDTKIIIIDYLLPDINSIPTLKEVKYIKTKDELKESYLAELLINKMYDGLLYKITLRSLYELFKYDYINAIESIVFNGLVKSIDKSIGKEVTNCILSIHSNQR